MMNSIQLTCESRSSKCRIAAKSAHGCPGVKSLLLKATPKNCDLVAKIYFRPTWIGRRRFYIELYETKIFLEGNLKWKKKAGM